MRMDKDKILELLISRYATELRGMLLEVANDYSDRLYNRPFVVAFSQILTLFDPSKTVGEKFDIEKLRATKIEGDARNKLSQVKLDPAISIVFSLQVYPTIYDAARTADKMKELLIGRAYAEREGYLQIAERLRFSGAEEELVENYFDKVIPANSKTKIPVTRQRYEDWIKQFKKLLEEELRYVKNLADKASLVVDLGHGDELNEQFVKYLSSKGAQEFMGRYGIQISEPPKWQHLSADLQLITGPILELYQYYEMSILEKRYSKK